MGIKKSALLRPFPSGTGIANLQYPTRRAGISTSIKLPRAIAKYNNETTLCPYFPISYFHFSTPATPLSGQSGGAHNSVETAADWSK
jgi:hypothetical protein